MLPLSISIFVTIKEYFEFVVEFTVLIQCNRTDNIIKHKAIFSTELLYLFCFFIYRLISRSSIRIYLFY